MSNCCKIRGPVPAMLLAVQVFMLTGCGQAEHHSGADNPILSACLPARGIPSGWSAGDSVQVYAGQELYELIDGGAELYQEYGFRKSATREYIGPEGALVIVGVYEMSDPEAAFGIFSAFRKQNYESLNIGIAGAANDYQIIFCKGAFYVDVQSLGQGRENKAALAQLSRTVESAIREGAGGLPECLGLLPKTDLIPGSLALVRGALGLNSIRYLSDQNIYGLSSATPGVLGRYVAGGDPEPLQLMAVRYPDISAAADMFTRLGEFYRLRAAARAGNSFSLNGNNFVYADESGEEGVSLREGTIYSLFAAPEGASLSLLNRILGG